MWAIRDELNGFHKETTTVKFFLISAMVQVIENGGRPKSDFWKHNTLKCKRTTINHSLTISFEYHGRPRHSKCLLL